MKENINARQELPASQGDQSTRQPVGYSRYNQEVFHTDHPDDDVQIQTNMSFHGISFSDIRGGNLSSPSHSVNDISSTQPVDSSEPGDFPKRNAVSQPVPLPSRDVRARPELGSQKKISRTPIIIIPASGTALITMYNAVDILEGLRYVSSDQRKNESRRETNLLIQRRKSDGSKIPYLVISDPRKLDDDDWKRVVAVFVQGPAWQFKGWRYNEQPTEIFSRIRAFHLKFDGQTLDKNVSGWSVKVLQLSQQTRHSDRAVLYSFWDTLDDFMIKNKPFLRF